LARDGTDVGPDEFLDLVRRAMRPCRHRLHDGQALGRHLHTVPPEYLRGIRQLSLNHDSSIDLILDFVKFWWAVHPRFDWSDPLAVARSLAEKCG